MRRKIDNVTSYFLISSKNLQWKQHFHTDRLRNYQLLRMAVCEAKFQGGDAAEARGKDEQPLSDKPPLIRCGETYSAW